MTLTASSFRPRAIAMWDFSWLERRWPGSGRWAAIATSNFCGPQFRGMWRDVAWHRHLTGIIRKMP